MVVWEDNWCTYRKGAAGISPSPHQALSIPIDVVEAGADLTLRYWTGYDVGK